MTSSRLPYQIISRRFRPQTFQDVLGQPAIVTTLKNALRFQRLAHAYLFCGTRGTGKTTIARVLAKALNCHQLTDNQEPCNQCPSCLEILSSKSLDVLEIDGASNRGIDDIRQINETMGYTPASGKFKIYIIDEVHMLTKEAFNALLKTLEEPPPTVKFFFATTEPHKILPTIISRCQRFDLHRIPLEIIQQKLESIAEKLSVLCQTEALALIAHLSEGSLRDAESLLDRILCYAEAPISIEQVGETLGLMPKEVFFTLDHAIAKEDHSFAFELANTVFSSGKDFSYFLEHLLEHFQTHLQTKWQKKFLFLSQKDQEHYQCASSEYSEEQLLYILDYLLEWQQQLSKTPFKRIGLEMVLLQLLRSKSRVSLSTITQRLCELQKTLTSFENMPPASPPLPNIFAPQETSCPPVKSAYQNNPKNQDSGEKASQNLDLEQSTITGGQSASGSLNSNEKLTSPKTDPSACFGTYQSHLKDQNLGEKSIPPTIDSSSGPDLSPSPSMTDRSRQSRYDTLIRFATVELEATNLVKKEI